MTNASAYLVISDDGTKIRHVKAQFRASIRHIDIPAGVREIGNEAFCDCPVLKSVMIGEGVVAIGPYAFFSCPSLERVEIPGSVMEIGEQAFAHCDRLKEVRYGGTRVQWEVIAGGGKPAGGVQTEESCGGVKVRGRVVLGLADELSLPEGVTEIAASVFEGCAWLRRIRIPASVAIIGARALPNTGQKYTIIYGGTKAQWKVLIGKKMPGSATVRCVDGIVRHRPSDDAPRGDHGSAPSPCMM